jgi:hypothetical protein
MVRSAATEQFSVAAAASYCEHCVASLLITMQRFSSFRMALVRKCGTFYPSRASRFVMPPFA